ncbi:MAG: phosphate ABC transporter permease subunit PstC [Cytophagaceae bacterium]|nr:phosphate ABC transporter permease subunit PstC [Cytophagaceae bacterium]MDW8455291.1 phosphate ABC transporter permease subunit PstC [Cytophagaceae bacterium]
MKKKEIIVEKFLLVCTLITVFTSAAIIGILLYQTVYFFSEVSVWEFFTNTKWTPLYYVKNYGVLPLLAGTFLTTVISLLVSVPLGLTIAIYLSEYAPKRFREMVKPSLEILSAIPTIVYGFFALTFVTPLLQNIFPQMAGFNALSPGIVMGIMILPLVSSLSEDALHAVPRSLREASLAMGATRFQTSFRVVIPAAFSGIAVSVILAISRAVGETMIVAIAAGQQPQFTLNPFVPIKTATTYIVEVFSGDIEHDTVEYRTIFAVGMTLFVFTFILNNISYFLKKRFQTNL